MSEPTAVLPSAAAPASPSSSSLVRAYLAVVAATVLWSSNVIAVKLMVREIPPFSAGLMRIILTAIALVAVSAAQRKPFPSRRAEWAQFVPLGLIGIGWSFLSYTFALRYTSVAHSVFIGALAPLGVVVLVVVEAQERISTVKLAGLMISLAGVLLLALDTTSGGAHWTGDALAFTGVWCFSYYTVRGKQLAAAYDATLINTYAFVVAAALCLPLLIGQASKVPWSSTSWVAWVALLYSATAGSAAPYVTYAAALRVLTSSQVVAFQYVQPVVSTLFGVWLLRETWGAQFAEGAALILIGVFLAERR